MWYSVVKGDPESEFYVSPDSGSLVLARRLDYERKNFYNLTVRVSDGRGRHADTHVVVTVLDVNEHRPALAGGGGGGEAAKSLTVQVSENVGVGSEVIRLEVADEDWHSSRRRRQKFFYAWHAAQDRTSLNKFKVCFCLIICLLFKYYYIFKQNQSKSI